MKNTVAVISQLPDTLRIAGTGTDPVSAMRDITRLKPDLVICEWHMPHTNGAKLMMAVNQAGIDSKFIILTRYESTTALRSFFTNGGLDYLSKPLDVPTLKAAVERFEIRTGRRPNPQGVARRTAQAGQP